VGDGVAVGVAAAVTVGGRIIVGVLVYEDGVTRGRVAVLRTGTLVNVASVAGKVGRVAEDEAAIATVCPLGAQETGPKPPKRMTKPKHRHKIFMPFVPECLQSIVWLPSRLESVISCLERDLVHYGRYQGCAVGQNVNAFTMVSPG